MKYVDAGYAIALGVLGAYAVSLMVRRHRLERAVTLMGRPGPGADGPTDGGVPR
ncbi:MAG TPA: hypothetical protein VKG43_12385 [Acidimicrobiales bacterium]|nr:hypothetical protein [Acidimicrobiales bacterium]